MYKQNRKYQKSNHICRIFDDNFCYNFFLSIKIIEKKMKRGYKNIDMREREMFKSFQKIVVQI